MEMDSYVWIGVIGMLVHFAVVGITYAVANSMGRNGAGWAGAAMISGPIALIVMLLWRGEPRRSHHAS